MTTREGDRYTQLELACVFCWFLLDGFWLMEWRTATYAFSLLALVAAGGMFRYIKRDRTLVLVACADTCWLVLNVLWAVGEMSHLRPAITASRWLFALGLVLCAAALATTERATRWSALVLSRLRIMKYFERKAPEVEKPRKGIKSEEPCDRCGAFEVYVSQDSDYDADYTIHCYACRHHYRVDGPDS